MGLTNNIHDIVDEVDVKIAGGMLSPFQNLLTEACKLTALFIRWDSRLCSGG